MQIEIFKYKSDEEQIYNDVRTIEENGEILFWATDVARVLGYSNANDAIIKHCKSNGVVIREVIDSLGRKQYAKFISEGNVYRLISRSRLKSAEKLKIGFLMKLFLQFVKKVFMAVLIVPLFLTL